MADQMGRGRLATRRRQALMGAVVTAVIAGGGLLSGGAAAAVGGHSPASQRTVVVAPGDTLWSLAVRHAPADASLQAYAARVAQVNAVDPAGLRPGSVLRLPAG